LSELFWCKICKGGYEELDQLDYHFRKEHTKNELIHFLKMEALKE